MKDKRKQDTNEFKRFDDLLRKVVSVPKDEIKKREQEEKQKKSEKKAD